MVITANAPMVAGTGTVVVGTLTCRNDGHASVEPHHSGRRPARHAVEEPTRGRQEVCGPVPTGALDAIGLQTRLRLRLFNKSEAWPSFLQVRVPTTAVP